MVRFFVYLSYLIIYNIMLTLYTQYVYYFHCKKYISIFDAQE